MDKTTAKECISWIDAIIESVARELYDNQNNPAAVADCARRCELYYAWKVYVKSHYLED